MRWGQVEARGSVDRAIARPWRGGLQRTNTGELGPEILGDTRSWGRVARRRALCRDLCGASVHDVSIRLVVARAMTACHAVEDDGAHEELAKQWGGHFYVG
jgi:hypothetical protein